MKDKEKEMSVLEKIDTFLNEEEISEATVEFYTHAQKKPSDILQIKDVPALLRAVGMGAKKISLESEGDRKALNKALKSGKYIYVAFNPFHEQMSGIHQILWFTDKKKFVKTYGDLAMEV
jgi:effector-binding domain-containing protein